MRLDQEERNAFVKFPRTKAGGSEHKYVKLFARMVEESEDIYDLDEYEEESLINWCKQVKLTSNYNDLKLNLRDKLLDFLARRFNDSPENGWRKFVEDGLVKVQALLKLELYNQAATLLLNLEKQIPKQIGAYKIWEDFSFVVRMANLKVFLARYNYGTHEVSKEDKFLEWIYGVFARTNFRENEFKSEIEKMNQQASKFHFSQLLFDNIKRKQDWTQEQGVITALIDEAGGRKSPYDESEFSPSLMFGGSSQQFFETCFWNMYGYGQAMHYGELRDAERYLEQLRNDFGNGSYETIIGFAFKAWSSHLSGTINIVELLREGQDGFLTNIPARNSFWERLQDATSQDYEFSPLRLELDRLVMLLSAERYEKAEVQVAKIRQLEDLPLAIDVQSRIVDAWISLKLARNQRNEKGESAYKFVRVKDKDKTLNFEHALSAVLRHLIKNNPSLLKDQPVNKAQQKNWEIMISNQDMMSPLQLFFVHALSFCFQDGD